MTYAIAPNSAPIARGHKAQALDALRFYGWLSLRELANRTGLTVVQIGRRMSELEKLGLALRATQADGIAVQRRDAGAGRWSQVWTAVR